MPHIEILLKELDKYIVPLDDFDHGMIDCTIKREDVEGFLNLYLKVHLDATKYTGEYRPIQTIGAGYKTDLSRVVFVIKELVPEDEQEEWLYKLIDRHKKNLEFEKEYPPIHYASPKRNKPRRAAKDKAYKEKVEKEREESLAEKKLKIKMDKLSKLSFKIV